MSKLSLSEQKNDEQKIDNENTPKEEEKKDPDGAAEKEKWEERSDCCIICTEEIKEGDTAFLDGCDHTYCFSCINDWGSKKKKNVCPYCRVKFSKIFTFKDGEMKNISIKSIDQEDER